MDVRTARERADEILAAWNSRDYGRLKEQLAEDVVVIDHTRGRKSAGAAGFVDRFRRVLEACPDMQGESLSVLSEGNLFVSETKWHGRHTVALELPNGSYIPPSDQTTTMYLVTYVELDDSGKAKLVRTYGNPRELAGPHTMGVG
jgi:SnoaL-like domain